MIIRKIIIAKIIIPIVNDNNNSYSNTDAGYTDKDSGNCKPAWAALQLTLSWSMKPCSSTSGPFMSYSLATLTAAVLRT